MNKIKGLKSTCGMTHNLGRYMGNNIQVFYDIEKNEVFGIYHSINEWAEMHDKDIVYVATYYETATQKEILNDVELTITEINK